MELLWVLAVAGKAASLQDTWDAHASLIASASPVPVTLKAGDAERLLRGEVVARRFEGTDGIYATGAVLVDMPIEAAWIAVQDAPHDPESRVRATWLTGAPPGVRRVYSTVDLPFPLADRQWVMEITNQRGLYEATGGAVWQRTWREVDPSHAPSPDPAAEWLPFTRGAWTLMETDSGTLMLFSVRTVFGGLVPASVTNGWAVSALRSSLAHTAELAQGMPEHYTSAHERVLTPAGAIIGAL